MTNQKIKAFFHDPIDKPLDLKSHVERAKEYYNLVNEEEDLMDENIKRSDYISAAADRIIFPKDKEGNKIIIDFAKEAELTHPLGSGNIKITDYGYINPDPNEVAKVVSQTIEEIKKEANGNEKLLLLNLWRNIPDAFEKFELKNFKLGNLWNLLPADTRIPDHSILDHNWLACAIAGSLSEPAFLKFSIGPIQGFITNAKRTEDYWMGSFLLSYLMSKAIEVIIKEVGPDHVIFPFIKGQPLIDKFLIDTYNLPIKIGHPEQRKIPSLSNIIFALLPADKSRNIAEAMKTMVNNSIKEISESIKKRFSDNFNSNIFEIWDKQIENLIEVYYTIYKWPSSPEQIKEQYQKIFNSTIPNGLKYKDENIGTYWQSMYKILDSSFNSRKNLRNFCQPQLKDELVKCSMCGEREVLHPVSATKSGELTKFWKGIGEKYPDKIDRKGRDKLCAVCFIKRMAGEYYFRGKVFEDKPINYPSTSTIAALPFKVALIEKFNKVDVIPIVDKYNNLLAQLGISGNFNWRDVGYIKEIMEKVDRNAHTYKVCDEFLSFDGQWLYEESFTKKSLEDNGFSYNREVVNGIKCAIRKMQKTIDDKPSKYFAVLAMDGDDMGKWLSGTHKNWPSWKDVVHSRAVELFDEETKRNLSPAIHSFISKSLNFFSLKLVRGVIESDYPGKLIYSGGDDVLAFLPLENILEAAEKTRFTFSGNLDENRKINLNHKNGYIVINGKEGKEVIPTLGNKATMSAGIVIAHKNHDLRDVLRQVREAEREAKDITGKNAFMIKILKHSGEITTCRMHWETDGKRILQQFNGILEKVSEDNGLSMSFFSAMAAELERLPKEPSLTLVKSLLKRQLQHHIHLKKKENESKEEYCQRKEDFKKELQEMLNHLVDESSKDPLNLILTLRFLATGGKR